MLQTALLTVLGKGRGATINPEGRFERLRREPVDDGWGSAAVAPAPLRTQVRPDASRTIIARNDSPDVPFDRSINPYRGCEHGCVYCYARPSHAYLGLSPGLDFETKLFAKHDAAVLLRRELARPGYACAPITLGGNTDAYQPVEKRLRITRRVLEVLAEHRHPAVVVTKSALVLRDLDLIKDMAAQGLARVAVSITTLDPGLARKLEPRAPAPHRRLTALRELSAAGVPTTVMVAPVVPGLTDHEIEQILAAASAAGAERAGYVLLRLPYEVEELMTAWLETHYPGRAARVLALVRQCRGGRLNDSTFGRRMVGQGAFADLIRRRFELACRRYGFVRGGPGLRTDLFRPPAPERGQLPLL
jgi:DNA repair photolyase